MVSRFDSKRYRTLTNRIKTVLDENGVRYHSQFYGGILLQNPNLTVDDIYQGHWAPLYLVKWLVTEDLWDTVYWERPLRYERVDATPERELHYIKRHWPAESGIDPKPTWEQLMSWFEVWELRTATSYYIRNNLLGEVPKQTKEAIIEEPLQHALHEAGIEIHHGFNHLESMIYHAINNGQPGEEHPLVLIPGTDNKTLDIWTNSELHGILKAQATRVNEAENVRNVIEPRLRKMAEPWFDEEKGGLEGNPTPEQIHEARLASYIQVVEALKPENMDKAFADEAERQRKESGYPDDPERAREVVKMRAGIIANRRRNEILSISESQDAFLPSGCVEESQALQRVSWLWQRATIMIDRANTLDSMKTILNTLQSDLNSIIVVNTPVWTRTDGAAMALSGGNILDIEWDPEDPPSNNVVVDLTATSPPDIGEGDEVAITVTQTAHGEPHNTNIWFVRKYNEPQDGDNRMRVSLQYVTPHLEFPEESVVSLSARNVCGPSALSVRVRRKAAA